MRDFERYYPISEFNYKHLKNKKLCSVYDDNIFPFFSWVLRVFHRELQDYFQIMDRYKERHAWRNMSVKLVKLTRMIG